MFAPQRDIKALSAPLDGQKLDEQLAAHKLDSADLESIKNILGRAPNLIELGIFSAMWSEHCSYKSSKKYLRGFPISAPWVVQGPGENAGVISVGKFASGAKKGKEVCAVFKMESHNHPSFIEPTAGAATGVGGIMRDVFTMGARPVASLNSIRFGEIDGEDSKNNALHKYLVKGVAHGIGGYGNCMGVPTIGGETSFEPCYNGNILVNAFTLGLCAKDELFYAKAEGVGNPVIYVGSKTGRDGLGGAVMSSDSFSEDSKALRPTVQVGDPFAEKLLLEACLELFSRDLIVGIQDMGAAGLTSSSFEMAGKSGSGMRLELDKVPMRESGMNPYELMLSESQERMLICAKKGAEKEVIEIFKKWELDVAIIGEVTDTGKMELFWFEEKCAEISIAPLSESAPSLDRAVARPAYLESVSSGGESLESDLSEQEIFDLILDSAEFADKHYIYDQYDSSVQTNTLVASGQGDGSVIRVKDAVVDFGAESSLESGAAGTDSKCACGVESVCDSNTESGTNSNLDSNKSAALALGMSVFCNARFCYLDPCLGAKIAVATAGRKVATRGLKPLAITDCLNFGSPLNPEVMWQFKEACAGIKEACEALKTPVVSGNVSLHNTSVTESNGVKNATEIYPTPSIAMVGAGSQGAVLDSALKKAGNALVLLGEIKAEFGGSLAQKVLSKRLYGACPKIDLKAEKALWKVLESAAAQKIIASAKSLDSGGLAVALTKMAILGNLGVKITTKLAKNLIFAESQSVAIVESSAPDLVLKLAQERGVKAQIIGEVSQTKTIKIDAIKADLGAVSKQFYSNFEYIMEKQ